jgi:hypothetical protein
MLTSPNCARPGQSNSQRVMRAHTSAAQVSGGGAPARLAWRRAYLVLDHRDLQTVIALEDAVHEGGLSRAQEPRDLRARTRAPAGAR